MEQQAQITSLAEKLSRDVRELYLGTSGEIERIQGAPSPLRFLRDFVLPNKPCVITHAIDHWPALATWSNAYLRAALTNQKVSVHFTPDGFADALVDLNRISSVFGCIIETPPPPCNPLRTESHAHSPQSSSHNPQLQRYVGVSANVPADGRDDVALNLGENIAVQPPASSPQLNCEVGAFVNPVSDDAHIGFMGDAASRLGQNNVVHVPTSILDEPQSNSGVIDAALKLGKHDIVNPPASRPDIPQMNGDVGAFATAAARTGDSGDASFKLENGYGARSGVVSCAKFHSAMGSSCNQPSNEHCSEDVSTHPSGHDTGDYVGQVSSTDSNGDGRDNISLGMNSLSKTPGNSSSSIKSREEKLQQSCFVTAHVERMPFSTALDLILHSEIGTGVAYAQEQNGCFLSEYSALAADAETHLSWATEAFGCLPEALLQEKNILLSCHLQMFTVYAYENIHLLVM